MKIHQSVPSHILIPVTTINDGIDIAIDYRAASGLCKIGVMSWCIEGSMSCDYNYGLEYDEHQQLCVRCGTEENVDGGVII